MNMTRNEQLRSQARFMGWLDIAAFLFQRAASSLPPGWGVGAPEGADAAEGDGMLEW
jgi:hypothetical protein